MRRYVNGTVAEMQTTLQKVYAKNADPAKVLHETVEVLKPAIERTMPKYQRYAA
jgi:hypothetical protein